jgi:uncharacterized protein with PQ loop repeat
MTNFDQSAPYTAISISIFARLIFMFLLFKNKSKSNYSLVFCILSIGSSSIWLTYGINNNDDALQYRSSTEICLLTISVLYIIKNKISEKNEIRPIN